MDASWVTQHKFAAAFLGSEIVVVGRLSPTDDDNADQERQQQQPEEEQGDFWGEVSGVQASGEVSTVHLPDAQLEFYPATKFNPNLSHLWAYLTVYQLLVGSAARDSREEATHIALEVYTKKLNECVCGRRQTRHPAAQSDELKFPKIIPSDTACDTGSAGSLIDSREPI